MGISFGSINTGLPKDIVKQIMVAENLPIQKMEERKTQIQDKQKLVKELIGYMEDIKTKLSGLQTEKSLKEYKVTGDEELVDFQVDKTLVEAGSYQFEVNSLAQKSSAMTNGFEDPDSDYVGVGFIQYTLPSGETRDLFVDPGHSTLRGIASLINGDRDNGMRATVVHDGTIEDAPWRMIVSLAETGDENAAEFPYFYFVDGDKDLYMDMERVAQDALVHLDGFPLEIEKNTAENLIPGLAIDLLKAAPGEEFTIQIAEDVQAIADKIKEMVESVNAVLKFIIEQNTMDENTDTRKTLGGDVSIQTIESRIRSNLLMPVRTEYGTMRMSEMGVQFQRTGLIELNENMLESAIKRNSKQVMQQLTGYFDKEDGTRVSGSLNTLYKSVKGILSKPAGVLPSRNNGLQSNIDQVDRQIETRQRMVDQKERMLKDKFARLEGTIARIRSQGNGLAGLASGGISDPVKQLG
ncbi:MAG: flagellar filament capping protein FliD [Bacteriovoracaceae bacterium]|nr:flagellar filament capping protein FliD [Bacteriovoracaceae bacterium]